MKKTKKQSLQTIEDIQREKQRLERKVEQSREAFMESLSLPSWKKTLAVSLGGLAATGIISYALKNFIFKTGSAHRPSKHGLLDMGREKEEAQVSNLARFAFLIPLLQTGLRFVLRRMESRMLRSDRNRK